MTAIAILVEVDVTSPAGVASTLRFADEAIRPMAPTDTLRANVAWDDRLIEAPTLRRALWDDMATLTPALGVGFMNLSNADGGLDAYKGHVWGAMRVWRWVVGTDFSTATRLFSGVAAPPRFSEPATGAPRVSAGLYDYRAELDKPIQATTYSAAGGTYDGSADGLKGRPKPLAYGRLTDAHLPAPQVNGALLAYQLHDGAVDGGIQIFDRGTAAGFTSDGDLTGAAFDSATPAAAHSVTDKSRGLLKINGDPVGKLTFGVRGDASPTYVETAGPIAARILAKAGVPGGRIGASVAALTAAAPVGIWEADQINASALIARLGRSVAASIAPDRMGLWQATAFAAPAGVASLTIEPDQIVSVQADDSAPDPVGVVRIGWGKVFTTFAANELPLALVKSTTAERLASTWRWAVVEDATVKARLPGTWRTLEIETALRVESDAIALANSYKALFGLRADGTLRRQWRVVLEDTDAVRAVALGATVRLKHPPRGIDDLFVLVEEEPMRPRRDLTTWTLWG